MPFFTYKNQKNDLNIRTKNGVGHFLCPPKSPISPHIFGLKYSIPNGNLQNIPSVYTRMDVFSLTGTHKILNVVYAIGNLGYCPFWFLLGGACYFVNVAAIAIGGELSDTGLGITKIHDPSNVLTRMQAIKENNNIRIKITVSNTVGFIGIMPLRILNTPLVESFESDA